MNYENLIDPTEFRTVQSYLLNNNSSIHFVLNVKNPAMLAQLASELDPFLMRGEPAAGHEIWEILRKGMKEGNLLFTGRRQVISEYEKHEISIHAIPASTNVSVIYLPPFYLVHTPGLFEGTLVRKQVGDKATSEPVKDRSVRFKI